MPDVAFGTFQRLEHETFQLDLGDGRQTPLVLTECRPLGPDGSTESFSLTFLGGPDAPAEQATYLLSADGLDPSPVFLVPLREIASDTGRRLEYQAIFHQAVFNQPVDNRATGGPR